MSGLPSFDGSSIGLKNFIQKIPGFSLFTSFLQGTTKYLPDAIGRVKNSYEEVRRGQEKSTEEYIDAKREPNNPEGPAAPKRLVDTER